MLLLHSQTPADATDIQRQRDRRAKQRESASEWVHTQQVALLSSYAALSDTLAKRTAAPSTPHGWNEQLRAIACFYGETLFEPVVMSTRHFDTAKKIGLKCASLGNHFLNVLPDELPRASGAGDIRGANDTDGFESTTKAALADVVDIRATKDVLIGWATGLAPSEPTEDYLYKLGAGLQHLFEIGYISRRAKGQVQ